MQSCGWICSLPKNNFGEANYSTLENKFFLRQKLQKQLFDIIQEILSSPRELLLKKSLHSLEWIKKHHNPMIIATNYYPYTLYNI